MSFWQIARCAWNDKAELDALLAEQFEPFAVTETESRGATLWLRKSTERQPAYAAAPRPRLEHEVVRLTRTTAGDAG
jgi:hypothetical protein